MKPLRLRVYQLEDGRFYVRYTWGFWDFLNREYFNTPEALAKFVEEILKGATEQKP